MAEEGTNLEKLSTGEIPQENPETSGGIERQLLKLQIETDETVETKSTKDLLENIDVEKPLNEQNEEIEALESVISTILIRNLGEESDIEGLLSDPEKLSQLSLSSEEEKLAISKLYDLLKSKQNNEQIKAKLSEAKDFAKKTFNDAEKIKSDIEGQKNTDETSWMSTGFKIGLFALGAYGGYRILRWGRSKFKAKEDRESFPFVTAALGTMAVGTLLGPEKVKEWAEKNLGVSVSQKSVEDFIKEAKEGNIREAFLKLTVDGQYPSFEKASEKLKISKNSLLELKDVKYKDFNNWSYEVGALGYKLGEIDMNKIKRKSLSYLNWILGFSIIPSSINIPLLSADNAMRRADDELKISDFIEKNKDRVGDDEALKEMTITEIFDKFSKEGLLD